MSLNCVVFFGLKTCAVLFGIDGRVSEVTPKVISDAGNVRVTIRGKGNIYYIIILIILIIFTSSH